MTRFINRKLNKILFIFLFLCFRKYDDTKEEDIWTLTGARSSDTYGVVDNDEIKREIFFYLFVK